MTGSGDSAPGPRQVLELLLTLTMGCPTGEATVKPYLTQHVGTLLPPLVLHFVRKGASSRAKAGGSPIDFVAGQLQKKTKKLLADHFHHIFPYIVVHRYLLQYHLFVLKKTCFRDCFCRVTQAEYEACIKWVEEETRVNIKELFGTSRNRVIIELLIHFQNHQVPPLDC